jgi:hypothetical protein
MKRLMLAIAVIGLISCQKDHDSKSPLPTIDGGVTTTAPIEASQGGYVLCYPDHGHGPTKWIHFPEDGTKNNVCFRDCICYYGC